MVKNTAGQGIGAQMNSATDGSNFTSTVTVYVTIDRGTQTIGSVGSGVCTHEGRGYHTYAPAQAETNGDLIAFTFTGTGAVSVTVQVYTSILTGDPYARLGVPVGASTSADIAAVQAVLPATLVSGRIDASVGAMAANTFTASALATDAGAEIADAIWDEATSGHSTSGTYGKLATDINAKTTNLPSSPAAVSDVAAQIAAALTATIADSTPADGTRPSLASGVLMLVRYMLERGVSGTTMSVFKEDGTTTAYTMTLNNGVTPSLYTRTS